MQADWFWLARALKLPWSSLGFVMTLSTRLPLTGHTVAVTRAAPEGDRLCDLLRAQGAEVLHLPLIRFGPTRQPEALYAGLRDPGNVDWLLLTSPQGSQRLRAEAGGLGLNPADFAGVRVAAVGESTARPLSAWGLNVTFQPSRATALRLGQELPARPGEVALHLTSQLSEDTLRAELTGRGVVYRRLELYRTEPVTLSHAERRTLAGVSVVTLASGSAVRGLAALAGEGFDPLHLPVAAIGEQTARAARQLGFSRVVTAPQPSLEGLVSAAVQAAQGNPDR